jgi:hypothetical protein
VLAENIINCSKFSYLSKKEQFPLAAKLLTAGIHFFQTAFISGVLDAKLTEAQHWTF